MIKQPSSKHSSRDEEIDKVLSFMLNGISGILKDDLIGLYLFGSLSYGDFNRESSDIDLVAIVNNPLQPDQLEEIKQLHQRLAKEHPKWSDRLECSYTPVNMLKSILPPKQPRPYFGGGVFYDEAPYGNEWIINNYLLYQYGISLIGSEFKTLIDPIDIVEVQKACIRDLFQEWEPKINDFEWLANSHYQSYLVLNLCRILYTVMCGSTATKKVSAEWVKNQFGSQWINLIETAENWKYGQNMLRQVEAIDFIRFTIDKIKESNLYGHFTFKPLQKSDLDLLCHWLNQSHVKEWWDDHLTDEEMREKYGKRIGDSVVVPYIVCWHEKPIGFIQYYVANKVGDGWWPNETDETVGIDQFIGEKDLINRGIGTKMVRAFIDYLFLNPAVKKIITDVDPKNTRALRCYQKAGFILIKEMVTPDGPAYLMEIKRSHESVNKISQDRSSGESF